MYIPEHNAVSDQALLHDLMRRFNFATFVTMHDGSHFATHLPFLVYPDRGDHGSLVGHMARANAQWKDFDQGVEALVIFQGPHTYISPSWYETQPSVPTWNYVVAHAYGVPQLIEDEARVWAILKELVAKHEEGFAKPWRMDNPDDYLRKMMRGIVAFEIPITRLEGKFKLSQNRSVRDQSRVVEALAHDPDPDAQRVMALMRALIPNER